MRRKGKYDGKQFYGPPFKFMEKEYRRLWLPATPRASELPNRAPVHPKLLLTIPFKIFHVFSILHDIGGINIASLAQMKVKSVIQSIDV